MNNITATTYEHMIIEPFEFAEINDIEIVRKVNEHALLKITGKISEEIRDNYVEECDFGTEISVKEKKETALNILFIGIINSINLKQEGSLYLIEINAYSKTFFMDIKKKKRTFQNIEMSYTALIKAITSEYKNAQVIIDEKFNTPVEKFLIQYEETDWEFIKRLASHFNQGLYPEIRSNSTAYYAGSPHFSSNLELEQYAYKITKSIGNYAISSKNYIDNILEVDFIIYQVSTYQYLRLGEKVTFRGIPFYIKSVKTAMQHAILVNEYELCTKAGLQKDKFYNTDIQGISVKGRVLDVKRDKIQVHIYEVDETQSKDTAYWFPYSTIYASKDGSGWYCMPEIGDAVRIQFPSEKDEDAYSISSISKYKPESDSEDRMKDYKRRYIRNPQGMEIVWTPKQVIISANEKCVAVLDENGTISIHADTKLIISSDGNISISAGNKIDINAADNINIKCGNKAEINLNKNGITELKGNKVYTN